MEVRLVSEPTRRRLLVLVVTWSGVSLRCIVRDIVLQWNMLQHKKLLAMQ
jgi:hypothetical protein